MNTGYRKIWRDLWRSLGRTILAVFSITVGVFAIGMVAGLSDIVPTSLLGSYHESNPSHLIFFLAEGVDDNVLSSLARLPGVSGVAGRLQLTSRWRPNPDTPWRNATIVVLQDFADQKFDRIQLAGGQWPDANAMATERTTVSSFGVPASGSVTLLIGNRERAIQIDGVVSDLQVNPPAFGGNATFYASREMAEALFGVRDFSEVKVQIPIFSQKAAEETSEVIKDRLKETGAPPFFIQIRDPNEHPAQDILNGIFLILGIMAILSLGLGLFLVINTIGAIVSQQVSQIGVMKAVGATTRQLLRMYLSGVLIYGVLALLIAVPLGGLAAYALSGGLLSLLNSPVESFRFSSSAMAQQVAVGLLTPTLAGLFPVLSGVRITVREAISSYGIGTGYGNSRFDRVLSWIRGLPRPMALTLRNTFRRKARVTLTQITLIMAGLVFMMVMSASESFRYTIDFLINSLGLKVLLGLEGNLRSDEAISIITTQPGVDQVEMRLFRSGTALRNEDDLKGEDIFVNALPPDTQLARLPVPHGRWLLPADGHAVVINQEIATKLGVKVGDTIMLDVGSGKKTRWTVVGTVFDLSFLQRNTYVPIEVFAREMGLVGRASDAWVTTLPDDAATQARVAGQLRNAFESRGIRVGLTLTEGELRTFNDNAFGIITTLLLVMSGLVAIVGSIGLAGMLSINVLERRREIGVMRAIGASSFTMASLFVGEGMVLGLLAGLLAIPFSIPLGNLFASAIGNVLQVGIIYQFSWAGVVTWLVINVALSIAASAVPALRAARLSVRESLAYE